MNPSGKFRLIFDLFMILVYGAIATLLLINLIGESLPEFNRKVVAYVVYGYTAYRIYKAYQLFKNSSST